MKRLLLPMNLQFFAAPTDSGTGNLPEENENITPDPENTSEADIENDESDDTDIVDSEKVIEKLQKRIGKEQAEKNQTKTQLEQALQRIEELEKGSKKSVKEKSDDDKKADEQKEKDAEIAKLKSQIKVAEITQQADEVLKESGLTVGKEILSIIVNEDEEKTYSNVKAFVNFLNDQQKQWEVKRNTGNTPKKTPGTKEHDPFAAIAEKYK